MAIATPGAILTLGLGGTPSLMVTLGYGLGVAAPVDELIGRKYPRRGRSRRKVVEIPEDIPAAIEKITLEKAELSEELAEAQADLISVRMLGDNTVNRSKQIAKLTSAINDLEHSINVRREEEVLLLLSLMVME